MQSKHPSCTRSLRWTIWGQKFRNMYSKIGSVNSYEIGCPLGFHSTGVMSKLGGVYNVIYL